MSNTIYNVNNQICQMPLQFFLIMIYNAIYLYVMPTSLIVLMYFKLARYIQEMSNMYKIHNKEPEHFSPFYVVYCRY